MGQLGQKNIFIGLQIRFGPYNLNGPSCTVGNIQFLPATFALQMPMVVYSGLQFLSKLSLIDASAVSSPLHCGSPLGFCSTLSLFMSTISKRRRQKILQNDDSHRFALSVSIESNTMAIQSYNTVFIDTSLGTHLAMTFSTVDTVSDVKGKLLISLIFRRCTCVELIIELMISISYVWLMILGEKSCCTKVVIHLNEFQSLWDVTTVVFWNIYILMCNSCKLRLLLLLF